MFSGGLITTQFMQLSKILEQNEKIYVIGTTIVAFIFCFSREGGGGDRNKRFFIIFNLDRFCTRKLAMTRVKNNIKNISYISRNYIIDRFFIF